MVEERYGVAVADVVLVVCSVLSVDGTLKLVEVFSGLVVSAVVTCDTSELVTADDEKVF